MHEADCSTNAAAAASRRKEETWIYNASAPSSPSTEAAEHITTRLNLANAIASYVRDHTDHANRNNTSSLCHVSAELIDLKKEGADIIAAAQLVEVQLLQCLLHVRLTPGEVPSQPELPGDVCATTTMVMTREGERSVIDTQEHTRAEGATARGTSMQATEQHLREEATDDKGGNREVADPKTSTGQPSSSFARSPPPRPPLPPDYAKGNSKGSSPDTGHRQQQQQKPSNDLRRNSLARTASSNDGPSSAQPSPLSPASTPSSLSRQPSHTKAKELFHAYTHKKTQSLPTVQRAVWQQWQPSERSARSPSWTRSSNAPVQALSSPPPPSVDSASNGATMEKGELEKELTVRGERCRRRNSNSRRQRRGQYGADDTATATVHSFQSTTATEVAPLQVNTTPFAAAGSSQKNNNISNSDLREGHKTTSHYTAAAAAAAAPPHRTRGGVIRPLLPTEVASAVSSWPSRIAQYTLARRLAEAALSGVQPAGSTPENAGLVEDTSEQVQNEDEEAARSKAAAPHRESTSDMFGEDAGLKDLTQRIRATLLYTSLAAKSTANGGTADGGTETEDCSSCNTVATIPFPSFARFYLSDATSALSAIVSNKENGRKQVTPDEVVQNFLAQLTDALVSAAVVPDVDVEDEREVSEDKEVRESGEDKHMTCNEDGNNASSSSEKIVNTEALGTPLMLTGDMVKDIDLLLQHTPTILAASAVSRRGEGNPKAQQQTAYVSNPNAASIATPARRAVKRALQRLLHLAPPLHNATMCTTPLIVGALHRYKPDNQDDSCAFKNEAKESWRAGELSVRLVPAAEVLTETVGNCLASPLKSTCTTKDSKSVLNEELGMADQETTAPTPMFYNTLLIEVSGDDVTYALDNDSGIVTNTDALPFGEEEDAKTIFHADIPGMYRRQRPPHGAPAEQQRQQGGAREPSVGAKAEDTEQKVDTEKTRPRLSRRQCVIWQQLLSLVQFIHVTGTPAQVETTARYVALAIRHRREVRHQQQQHNHRDELNDKQSAFFPASATPLNVAANDSAAPSIAESALPVSVPAFFFTLTQTSSLVDAAAEAALIAATRTLRYDEDGTADLRNASPTAHPNRAEDSESEESKQCLHDQVSNGSGHGGNVSSSFSGPARQESLLPFSPGLGLRALLGWRTRALVASLPSTEATVANPPRSSLGSPLCGSHQGTTFRGYQRVLPTATAAATAVATSAQTTAADDLILKWMHDTLIPIFYETTVTCNEADGVDATTTAPEAVEGNVSDTNNNSGNRRRRYHLRRQRALLGRVQAITAAMVLNSNINNSCTSDAVQRKFINIAAFSNDEPVAFESKNAIDTGGDAAFVPSEAQLVSYLLLNQLFFDTAVLPSDAEVAASAAGAAHMTWTDASSIRHAGSYRAHSAPSANTYHTRIVDSVSGEHTTCAERQHHQRRHQQCRPLSATPHRSTRASSQQQQQQQRHRRVSFRGDTASHASEQRSAASETTTAPENAAPSDAPPTRLGSLLPSPSPKSILKSGRRYKAEKLVRNSAPAASVVPFRNLFLWRWLAAEVLTSRGASDSNCEHLQYSSALRAKEKVPNVLENTEEQVEYLRATELAPVLHLTSVSYVAQTQTLAVRVATDVAAALLLAGLQAEQYACYQQLLQRPSQADRHFNKENNNVTYQSVPFKTFIEDKEDANVKGEEGSGESVRVGELDVRNTTTFQCDDILLLAKGVAEAVVRAALAPVVYVAGVPKQLESVVQGSDLSAAAAGVAESSCEDEENEADIQANTADSLTDSWERLNTQDLNDRTDPLEAKDGSIHLRGKQGNLSVSSPAMSTLSSVLSPDVFQHFQVLFAVCTYRVQREIFESLTRPLDLGLRRLAWSLGQHRLQLLCQPLLDFWKSPEIAVLADVAAASASISPTSSSPPLTSLMEPKELQKRCVEAEDTFCVLVGQVLQLYEECLLLPHLLSGAGAPRAVELNLGTEEDAETDDKIGEKMRTELAQVAAPLEGRLPDVFLPHEERQSMHSIDVASLTGPVIELTSPLTPLQGEKFKGPPLTRDCLRLGSALYTNQRQHPHQNSSPNVFVPLCFGKAKFMLKASMAAFAIPVQSSIPPQQKQQQQELPHLLHFPCWLHKSVLSTWSPAAVDADNSFDLHNSLRCDCSSLCLNGGYKSIDKGGGGADSVYKAASDFALAVSVAPPQRRRPPPMFQIKDSASPNSESASSRARSTTTTTTAMITATTGTTYSTPGILLNKSNLTLGSAVAAPPQGPVENCCREPVEKGKGKAVCNESSVGASTGAPQSQKQQLDSHGMSSRLSFLTFNAVAPTSQPLCVPAFSTSPREENQLGDHKVAETASLPPRLFLLITQHPTPVGRLKQSNQTERAQQAAVVEETNGESRRNSLYFAAPAFASAAAEGKAHADLTPTLSAVPHIAAQLRRGDVVESRLLSPFVEETKRVMIGLLLQKWVLPRWGLLAQMGLSALKQSERQQRAESNGSLLQPSPRQQQQQQTVPRTSTQVQTDTPVIKPQQPQLLKQHKQQLGQSNETKFISLDGDSVGYRDDQRGSNCTAEPSFDAFGPVDETEETGKPQPGSEHITPLAASLPPLSPPTFSPLTAVAVAANSSSCVNASIGRSAAPNLFTSDTLSIKEDDGNRPSGDAELARTKEENAALRARMHRLQHVVDGIVYACRGLSTAAMQCELALVLEGPSNITPLELTEVEDGKGKGPAAGAVTVEAKNTAACRNDVQPLPVLNVPTRAHSPSVTLPVTSGSTTPSPSLHPPQYAAATRTFLTVAREERERILALCTRMSNLLARGLHNPLCSQDEEGREEDYFDSTRSPPFNRTRSGVERHGSRTSPPPPPHDTSLNDQMIPIGSLSQGVRGSPRSASSGTTDSQQQEKHRRGSLPCSIGPSQLFAPLHEPIRRPSTAFTLTSVPAPLRCIPSNTLISTLSSNEVSINGDTNRLDGSVLVAVPAAVASGTPIPTERPEQQRSQLTQFGGSVTGEPAQVSVSITLNRAAVVDVAEVAKATLRHPTTSSPGAPSHGANSATTAHSPLSSVKKAETHRDVQQAPEKERGEKSDVVAASKSPIKTVTQVQLGMSEPTEAPDKDEVIAVHPSILCQDCAQQTHAETPAEMRHEAHTQTQSTQLPIEQRKQGEAHRPAAVHDIVRSGTVSVSDDEHKSRSHNNSSTDRSGPKMRSLGSDRSVETAVVTPYKHERHQRYRRRGTGEGADGMCEEIDESAEEESAHQDEGDEENDDLSDNGNSSLSPVSVRSSNRQFNAIASGCSSPPLSSVSLSSVPVAAAPFVADAEQEQQQQQSNTKVKDFALHQERDDKHPGNTPQTPTSQPPVARCTLLTAHSPTPSDSPTPKQNQPTVEAEKTAIREWVHDGDGDDSGSRSSKVTVPSARTSGGGDEEGHVDAPHGVNTMPWCGGDGGTGARSDKEAAAEVKAAGMMQTTTVPQATPTIAMTSVLSSPYRERTPTRSSEAAVTALADLQQRLGGSNSTITELRRQLERAEEDVHERENTILCLQQQLVEIKEALRVAVESQEAEIQRLQLRPPPPLTPARCTATVNTDGPDAHECGYSSLLPPTATSTSVKQQDETREVAEQAPTNGIAEPVYNSKVERVNIKVQVNNEDLTSPCLPLPPPPPLLSLASTESSQTTPPDPMLATSQLSAERRVRELEADLRNATFRMAQWRGLLEAERHARAVQVDQLTQQLESEQRRLQRRERLNNASRSRSRSLSPFDVNESKPLSSDAGAVTEVVLPVMPNATFSKGKNPQSRFSNDVEDNQNVVGGEDASDNGVAIKEFEEQRVTAALTQQAAELQEREAALQRHVASVLDRLHTTEKLLQEQQDESKRKATASAAALEEQRMHLEQRVAELEGELDAVRLREEQSLAHKLSQEEKRITEDPHTSRDEVGVQTEDGLDEKKYAAVAAAAAASQFAQEEAETTYLATVQRLQDEITEVRRKQANDKALRETEMKWLLRDCEDKARKAEEAKAKLEEEQAAHARTKMAFNSTQSAAAAKQLAHKIEAAIFQRDTATWWTTFEALSATWSQEKSLLLLSLYEARGCQQATLYQAAVASAEERAAVQETELNRIRSALTTARDDAGKREDELLHEIEALRCEATALAAVQSAAANAHEMQTMQEAHLRSATSTWWEARDACTLAWTEAKQWFIIDAYQFHVHTREEEHSRLRNELCHSLATRESTINALEAKLLAVHREADLLKQTLQNQEEGHANVVAGLQRVNAAHRAAQEVQNKEFAYALRSSQMWWTARQSALSDWVEAKLHSVESVYASLLRAEIQRHRNETEQSAVASVQAHEAALNALRNELSKKHSAEREESYAKLRKEEEAHARTVAALEATRAASAAVRRADVAQLSRLQRSTAAWWEGQERCAFDWMTAKAELLQSTYAVQHQHFYRSMTATATEYIQHSREAASTQVSRNAHEATKPIKATCATLRHENGTSTEKIQRETNTPCKAVEANSQRSTRSSTVERHSRSCSRSPDVVMMSLEDPLGLRYELQHKTRRIHSLEGQIRQLEEAHLADRKALATMQSLAQQERCGVMSPLSNTSVGPGAVAAIQQSSFHAPSPSTYSGRAWPPPPVSPATATPSRTPFHNLTEGGWSSEGKHRTPPRTPGSAKSRRLTPDEYRQRFAEL